MLFILVNCARKFQLDPEEALNHMNEKFMRRFTFMEDEAERCNKKISECDLDTLEAFWQKAKVHLRNTLK
jgi:uncharacterized protein YabN with tetrapyrrole methylase and pyrophosphatase domain